MGGGGGGVGVDVYRYMPQMLTTDYASTIKCNHT